MVHNSQTWSSHQFVPLLIVLCSPKWLHLPADFYIGTYLYLYLEYLKRWKGFKSGKDLKVGSFLSPSLSSPRSCLPLPSAALVEGVSHVPCSWFSSLISVIDHCVWELSEQWGKWYFSPNSFPSLPSSGDSSEKWSCKKPDFHQDDWSIRLWPVKSLRNLPLIAFQNKHVPQSPFLCSAPTLFWPEPS